ncbi:MAG: transporter [Nitrospirae bacterium]|nr:transporter [Nitrospirota bacterium]
MKKRVLLVFLLSAVLCIFSSQSVFAAWTQAKGHSYNQLGFSYYRTNEKTTTLERDAHENLVSTNSKIEKEDSAEFTSAKMTYYVEYGIIDSLTVVASIPFDRQRSDDTVKFSEEDGPSGVGDINLGLRYLLMPNLFGTGVLMSVQGDVKIPEAYNYGHPLTHLSLGDGQYDAALTLKFGRGLPKGYIWANVGYKYRFENDQFAPLTFKPSDKINVAFGGGYPIVSWLSLTGYLEWARSASGAKVSSEMVDASLSTGLDSVHAEEQLKKDSLALEPDTMSGYIGLQFNLPSGKYTPGSVVLSYAADMKNLLGLKTKNSAMGETFGLALVRSF